MCGGTNVALASPVLPRSLVRNLTYALIGVALGGLGLGWHGRPSDPVIVAAIRGRSPENARATIALLGVTRDWVHEVFSNTNSRFLVTASLAFPDGSSTERCYGIEPGLAGIALALGPYQAWRCAYPF